MLRLGTPKRTAEKQVVGDNTVYQDFTPDSNTLNLSFRLFSWEARGQDLLKINLTNSTGASVGTLTPFTINMGGTPVTFNTLPVQTTISMPKTAKFVDTGWVKVTITNIPQNQVLRATYTIGGTKDNAHATWAYFDGNTPPVISADQTAITANEGQTATNAGKYSDADSDTVSLTASTGNVSVGATPGTWKWTNTYLDGPTQGNVTITANDGNGGVTSVTFTVTVNNVAPANVTLSAAPAAINENDSTTVNGTFTDPGTLDTHKVVIDWGDGSATTSIDLAANVLTFSASHKYLDNKAANAAYTVGATITDKDSGSGNGSANVAVNNVAPANVTLSATPAIINENESTTVSGSFTDPGTLDTHNLVIDWGDGSTTTSIDLAANVFTFSASHKYLDNKAANAPYTIGATVTDKDGGSGNGSASVTVNNVAPANVTLSAAPPAINENDSTTVSGSFTDPGTSDTHTLVIDWGDGSATTSIDLAANVLTFTSSHKYLDNKMANATYTIGATVTDKDGGSGNGSASVTVNNVAPANVTLSATPAIINENDSTTVSGSFTDPGTLDTHKVVIDWGDGSATTGIDLAANVLTFSASHKYLDNKAANAPYTISATITDKDGGSGAGNTTVTVNNVAPTATLIAPDRTPRRSTFNISLTNPSDPGTADVAAGFNYALDCGSGYGPSGTAVSATCNAVNAATTQIVKGKIQDKDGGVTEYSANVVVFNNVPIATVTLNNTSPKTNDILTATATRSDPDNDPVTLNFVWKKNGTVMKTTAASPALTDTYDLSIAGNGDKNDTITIEVTPNDGLDNGASVSAQAIVINSLPVARFAFTLGHTASPNYPNHATDPMEGSRIQFKDLSYDPDTGDTIRSWQWNISGPVTGPNGLTGLVNVTSTVQSPYFRPPDNGVYIASLTATSSDGTSTTVVSPTQTPTITDAGGKILARRLLVVNTPAKVNALNIEVRSGDSATLFGRFLDHGWLDKHTATFTVEGIAVPIPGTVKESNTAIVDTGIVTASLSGTSISNALVAAGKTTLPATLSGSLTVFDSDKNSRTGTHASRTDKFTITVRADNPNINEPNNDLTSFAPPILTTGSIYFSYMQSAGDVDIFELKQPNGILTTGSEVLVTLKGLPADFDVALLAKIPAGAGSQGQFGTATFDLNNLKISGFDDGGFDDGGFDDGGFDDGGFDDGGFDDGGFDDGGFDDGGFDDGGFDDGGLFHGGFDDGGFDDGGFDDGGSFENSSLSNMSSTGIVGSNIGGTDLQLSELALSNIMAPGYTVAGFSANRGVKDEAILIRLAVPNTQLFVVVTGSNGARSATPYLLQIESSSPKVKVFAGSKLVNPPAPQAFLRQDSAPKTLFVTQRERLTALYNMDATAWNALQGKLVSLASHSAVQGDILSLPSNIFDNWDLNPSSVDEANNTATQIRTIIQNYLTGKPGIQNVVIVGSDDVVPFRRVPDETVIANERYYLRSSYLKLGSPLFSSVMLGNNLTDDYYVSIKPAAWQGRELYVPELSVGRLVETPLEIGAAADAFLNVNGVLSPTTAFVGGYDFFTDGSQVLASNLASGGLAVNNVVNPTWTADNLRSNLLGTTAKDINAPNAHFTHYAILSAYGFATKQRDIVTSIDVKQAVDALVRRVLFTIGCHSGLNVPDRESRTVDPSLGINPALDFAQAMAQQRALYIANTGYGLGDTDGLAGTELLLTYLAKNLVQGDISMGKALISAKQLYLSSTSPLTVYDEKSSIQATLYGLPMYRVMVSNPSAGGPVPSGSNTLSITDSGATTTIPYTLQPMISTNGTYYTANGDAQATAGRPVEPRIVKLLNNTGGNVHGVLLTAGTFTDTAGFDPVINRPTNEWELNPAEPLTALPSFWPAQAGALNNLALANGMLQSLIVTPGQFKATTVSGIPVRGIQRLYSNLSLELMRSTSNDWQPPVINSVDFRGVNDTTVAVTVNASDPSGIARIVVLRISNGSLSPTSLVLNSPLPASGAFTLNVPFTAGDTILVEVVDGAGNISSATGKGATFSVIKVDASIDQVGAPGQPVVLRAAISGFETLTKPVSYLLDFGDGTFADGQTTVANFTVQHTYASAIRQATATLKITDAGGGVGVDKVLLIFDASSDIGAISSNGDLVGGSAWIDSTSMTIVLRVTGLITDDFQYRVRIEAPTGSAHLRYDGGKVTGLPGLTGSATGNQLTLRFNLADLGLRSGDTIQLYTETQDGVKATQGAGNVDRMPDTGSITYVLY